MLMSEPASRESAPIADLARGLLIHVGEDPNREGLLRTPQRFEKALKELTSGYSLLPAEVVGSGIFASESRGIVCVKGIEFFSLCEHHVLPFWGKASIAYFPEGKILGLSKLARLLDLYAKRLQVQERLTRQVGEAVKNLVGARAVAVSIEAQHMCMMMRGVCKQGSSTRTEFTWGEANLSPVELASLQRQQET